MSKKKTAIWLDERCAPGPDLGNSAADFWDKFAEEEGLTPSLGSSRGKHRKLTLMATGLLVTLVGSGGLLASRYLQPDDPETPVIPEGQLPPTVPDEGEQPSKSDLQNQHLDDTYPKPNNSNANNRPQVDAPPLFVGEDQPSTAGMTETDKTSMRRITVGITVEDLRKEVLHEKSQPATKAPTSPSVQIPKSVGDLRQAHNNRN